jgi:hypothetical protein
MKKQISFLGKTLMVLCVVAAFAGCEKDGDNSGNAWFKHDGKTYELNDQVASATIIQSGNGHVVSLTMIEKNNYGGSLSLGFVIDNNNNITGTFVPAAGGIPSGTFMNCNYSKSISSSTYDIWYVGYYTGSIAVGGGVMSGEEVDRNYRMTSGSLSVSNSNGVYTVEGFCTNGYYGKLEFYYKGKLTVQRY